MALIRQKSNCISLTLKNGFGMTARKTHFCKMEDTKPLESELNHTIDRQERTRCFLN
jgi:hypothetical protein